MLHGESEANGRRAIRPLCSMAQQEGSQHERSSEHEVGDFWIGDRLRMEQLVDTGVEGDTGTECGEQQPAAQAPERRAAACVRRHRDQPLARRVDEALHRLRHHRHRPGRRGREQLGCHCAGVDDQRETQLS